MMRTLRFGLIALWALLAASSARADLIYVTNFSDNSVYRIASDLSSSLHFTDIDSPEGIALDSAGNVYVASYSTNLIAKYDPSGEGVLFAGADSPMGLAFDSSGNLYVAASVEGVGLIEKFTPSGFGSVFATLGPGMSPFALTFDSSGNLYTSVPGANKIEKFSSLGVDLGAFADAADELDGPSGLAFRAGNLYAANANNQRIWKFDSSGNGTLFGVTHNDYPNGLAFDSNGFLYSAVIGGNIIERFDSTGEQSDFYAPLSGPAFLAIQGPASVPEPSSLVLASIGAIGMSCGAIRRKLRSRKAAVAMSA